MPRRTIPYVLIIVAAALIGVWTLYLSAPAVEYASLKALVLLAALAIVAEMLAIALPNAASGSIAFIPYLATVIIVPSWAAVAAVAAVKLMMETRRRAAPIALFNVASHALTTSAAIWTYLLLGGESLLGLPSSVTPSLVAVTGSTGFAALLAFTSSFFANALIVCGFLAIKDGKRIAVLWRQLIIPTIAMDLIASPLVFVFAWVYSAYGPIAAAALWVPILGLREVHRANIELQRTNQELLQLMVKSIEARDPYTSGHSKRVQHYSTIIARALGLAEKEVERVGRAALLHDVGKIYEKYAPILRKEDKLDPAEWLTMKEHPEDGASLVATMTGLHELVPAVRHHHENWDGTGYPAGLVGEQIPLASRIIAFADTIDAMTSERPYRAPLAPATVKEEILRCRGRQFDPSITDALLATTVWSQLFASDHRVSTGPSFSVIRGKRVSA